jgi:hypothetical protein
MSGRPWTDAEHKKLVTMFENGATTSSRDGPQTLKRSRRSSRRRSRTCVQGPAAGESLIEASDREVLDLPARPLAVPRARNIVSIDGKPVKAVIVGDRQVPFHDPAAMSVARSIIRDVNPDILLDMGDGLDCWQISDYDTRPAPRGHATG